MQLVKAPRDALLKPLQVVSGIVDLAFLPEGKLFVSRDRSKRTLLWDGGQGALKMLRDFAEEPLSRLASASRPDAKAASLACTSAPTASGTV